MSSYLLLQIKKLGRISIQKEKHLKPWITLFFIFLVIFAVACLHCPQASYADFTIVVYPDSQHEVDTGSTYLPIWQAQNSWVVNNISAQNIVALLAVGDIANSPSGAAYTSATVMGYDLIDSSGLTYLPLMGNHDFNNLRGGRITSLYDDFFGPMRFAGKSWYLEGYPAGSNANLAITFDVGVQKYLVLGLEFFPRASAVAWAQGVIDANPDREVIVVTHAYLTKEGALYQDDDNYGPAGNGLTEDYNGQELWDNFIKLNSRIFLVISGHDICTPNNAHLISSGTNGNIISQIFTNYQCHSNGGDGYILLLKFKTDEKVIEVTPYSTNLAENDPNYAPYILPYNPTAPTITSVSTGPAPLTEEQILRVMVNDNGALTTVNFEYGLTTDYGTTVTGGTVTAGSGNGEVSANISGLSPGITYHARAIAGNIAGTVSTTDFLFTVPYLQTILDINLTVIGSGRGLINFIPSVIVCSNSCYLELNANSTVNLIAVPDSFSVFSGWSGDCSGLNCTLTMNARKSVNAEFTAVPPVMAGTTAYQNLQDAFNETYSNATIKAFAAEFIEDLILNRDISISLDGGYDKNYNNNSGVTTIKGSLTIENGTIVINKVILQ